jgi:sRNA-binding regulator protein Hfq
MNEEEVRKYVGKKVILFLKNGYKLTTAIPEFQGSSFTIIDKYSKEISLDCEAISIIIDNEGGNE